MTLDPHTPVVVGVGQSAERIDDPDYRAMSPVELAATAARAALVDCGADFGAVAAAVDMVAGVRQFEISGPVATAPLGRSNNYPRSVANRIGAQPARAILEIVGGQGPQHLISELAADIAAGRSDVAMIFGSDATSTLRHFARAENKP
ncbi:MAG TPA: acetyl-CoA acetyltransferase, partial [Mycobacterium sp.]|nr:acetyl-CoA acetyltransferase [Mycobacterium sp.]